MNEMYKLLALVSCILLGITLAKMQPVELSASTNPVKRKSTPKPHSEETSQAEETNVHPTR